MCVENYRLLGSLIAAHPNRTVVGRTRLQKEVKLLQRVGFPTHYSYTIHFFGPYSEELRADTQLLEAFGLITEKKELSQDGNPYFVLVATSKADAEQAAEFRQQIELLDKTSAIVLELAATYDAFREQDGDHQEALQRLRRKKGWKCEGGNEQQALDLLGALGLPCC